MDTNEGVYVAYHKDFDRPLYVGQSKNLKRRFKEHISKSQNIHKGIFYELAVKEVKNNGIWAKLYSNTSRYRQELEIAEWFCTLYGKDVEFKVVSEDINTEQEWIYKLNPICNKSRLWQRKEEKQ
jgi:hypothetical protein